MYILASSFENPQFKSITRLIVFRLLFGTLTLKTFTTNIMRYSPIPWAVLGFQYVYKYLLFFVCAGHHGKGRQVPGGAGTGQQDGSGGGYSRNPRRRRPLSLRRLSELLRGHGQELFLPR